MDCSVMVRNVVFFTEVDLLEVTINTLVKELHRFGNFMCHGRLAEHFFVFLFIVSAGSSVMTTLFITKGPTLFAVFCFLFM